MDLKESSIDSLRARVRHLQADFQFWLERTSVARGLTQHQSQVERITDTLNATIEASLGETPVVKTGPVPASVDMGSLPEYRRAIGSIHLLWEFFRDMLAQRDVEMFENHLGAADDLAWACYKKCLDGAVAAGELSREGLKEPPLVFYSASTRRTPFAKARTKTFSPQGLDSGDLEDFQAVLQHLPVPVIGLPWSLANRLPDLVLVGHETGHVVAEDLGLAAEARTAVKDMTLTNDPQGRRKGAWLSWCDEVFADLFGVVATGHAFVAGLGAELAADVDEIHTRSIDEQRPGLYPTPTIRMALCEEALKRLGVTPFEDWEAIYQGLSGDSRRYENDIEPVVAALLLRNWIGLGNKMLTDLLPWGPRQEQSAQRVADAALGETSANVAFDVRVWIAGSMSAFRSDAATYAGLSLDRSLAKSIVDRRSNAVRSVRSRALRTAAAPGRRDAQLRDRQQSHDKAVGMRICDMLGLKTSQ